MAARIVLNYVMFGWLEFSSKKKIARDKVLEEIFLALELALPQSTPAGL